MKITDLISQNDNNLNVAINQLKARQNPVLDYSEIRKSLNPLQHKIFDKTERPDKVIQTHDGQDVVKVNRIGLDFQNTIVEKAVSFLFGIEPVLQAQEKNEAQQRIVAGISKILKSTKSYAMNRRLARAVFSCGEAAEYWFTVETGRADRYGFESTRKVRSTIFSPLNGDLLYPVFDATGDMVAFSREFQMIGERGLKTTYFETYTAEETVVFKRVGSRGSWEIDGKVEVNPIGKIPVVYVSQGYTEWERVQPLIDRLEKLFSNFGDTNDYHGSPKLFIKGKVLGVSKKGESGSIIEGEQNTEIKYLSWEHAPESVKLEIDTLITLIYELTQTARVSFENVKGLGSFSGVGLKLMFMDSHLKVSNKEEYFGEALERRLSILKSYLAEMHTPFMREMDNTEMELIIKPYMIGDEAANIEMLMTASGGKAVISQETAIDLSGMVSDSAMEFERLKEEAKSANMFDIFEPTV